MTETTHKSSSLTPVQRSHLAYWRAFNDLVAGQSTVIKPCKPQPQADMDYSLGRSKFRLVTFANTRDTWIGVRLVIEGPNAKPFFHSLQGFRQEIESEVGAKLDWREMPHKKSSRVYLTCDANPRNRDDWPRQHDWLLKTLEAFYRAFAPRIVELGGPAL